ncbi:hypothetical protein CDL15_Pgr001144 [Punica granatum]|uniref:Uncharacterized protein n=1 Tax=Punica granatum TaxID=22663 RepID=A0A218WKX8_PUNGR|nr:hypothetical protein CDL15_Pgr001144 [Punica granatum]
MDPIPDVHDLCVMVQQDNNSHKGADSRSLLISYKPLLMAGQRAGDSGVTRLSTGLISASILGLWKVAIEILSLMALTVPRCSILRITDLQEAALPFGEVFNGVVQLLRFSIITITVGSALEFMSWFSKMFFLLFSWTGNKPSY